MTFINSQLTLNDPSATAQQSDHIHLVVTKFSPYLDSIHLTMHHLIIKPCTIHATISLCSTTFFIWISTTHTLFWHQSSSPTGQERIHNLHESREVTHRSIYWHPYGTHSTSRSESLEKSMEASSHARYINNLSVIVMLPLVRARIQLLYNFDIYSVVQL